MNLNRLEELLIAKHDCSPEWAKSYAACLIGSEHKGDCSKAPPHLQGPITCDACVYEELLDECR